MAVKKKLSISPKSKPNNIKLDLEGYMLYVGKLIQGIWKATLASNLHKKDKAEILRFMIFAITIIVVIALFVLNQ